MEHGTDYSDDYDEDYMVEPLVAKQWDTGFHKYFKDLREATYKKEEEAKRRAKLQEKKNKGKGKKKGKGKGKKPKKAINKDSDYSNKEAGQDYADEVR